MAGQYEVVDLETVAALLRRSPRQINNYINLKGLPSQGAGRRRTFNWFDVLEWYVGYRIELEMRGGSGGNDEADPEAEASDSDPQSGKPEDIRAANLRKTRAEANLKELALSRQRSEVIAIGDAKARLDRLMGNLRARLLSMPPKLASRIEGLPARTDREAAIKEEIEAVCREISTGAVVGVPSEPEAVTHAASVATMEASGETTDPPAGLSDLDLLHNLADLLELDAYAAIER